jgi:hypothetical protein
MKAQVKSLIISSLDLCCAACMGDAGINTKIFYLKSRTTDSCNMLRFYCHFLMAKQAWWWNSCYHFFWCEQLLQLALPQEEQLVRSFCLWNQRNYFHSFWGCLRRLSCFKEKHTLYVGSHDRGWTWGDRSVKDMSKNNLFTLPKRACDGTWFIHSSVSSA